MEILDSLFLKGGILCVQIELEFIPSIFLARFFDDFSNVDAASDSRIMISPIRRGSSVTRFAFVTQNRSATAFRLLNVGHRASSDFLVLEGIKI